MRKFRIIQNSNYNIFEREVNLFFQKGGKALNSPQIIDIQYTHEVLISNGTSLYTAYISYKD